MTIDFTGRVVLVTGGSRGIGAECVKLFVECGAKVAFTFHKNESAAGQLISGLGIEADVKSYKVDAANEREVAACVRNIKNDFGRIDVLVNNAGIWKHGKIDEMSIGQWNETIETNLTGTFNFTSKVVPIMKENEWGRIINVASTAGQRGEPEYSHYAASKGGMISFTKSLAVELAPFGITANCVAPGWVYTDMSNDELSKPEKEETIKEYIPLGRAAYPEEIAGPIIFLASKLADHINGEILNVNGGSELCG